VDLGWPPYRRPGGRDTERGRTHQKLTTFPQPTPTPCSRWSGRARPSSGERLPEAIRPTTSRRLAGDLIYLFRALGADQNPAFLHDPVTEFCSRAVVALPPTPRTASVVHRIHLRELYGVAGALAVMLPPSAVETRRVPSIGQSTRRSGALPPSDKGHGLVAGIEYALQLETLAAALISAIRSSVGREPMDRSALYSQWTY
jgi:hypothetical protein